VSDHSEAFSRPREVRPARDDPGGASDRRAGGGGGCVRFGIEAVRGPSAICRGKGGPVRKPCRSRLVASRPKLAIPGHLPLLAFNETHKGGALLVCAA
jgi:hypothetical protein